MHGVIICALKEVLDKNFGDGFWYRCLEKSGLPQNVEVSATGSMTDVNFLKMAGAVCEISKLSLEEVADVFGDYWVNVYAPRLFATFYKGKNSAKEFLLSMNYVHDDVVRRMEHTEPPVFEFKWIDDKTLEMKYISKRGLIVLLQGLVKGVGKYYKEDLQITKISEEKLQIVFPK
ncbi:MAG: heme NO-binding domain-containing protein [Candidatus Omnitrophica bacterium]|nr:heme NO-binding domain-containing protein [Candidatus Omnitrophota bacterium]